MKKRNDIGITKLYYRKVSSVISFDQFCVINDRTGNVELRFSFHFAYVKSISQKCILISSYASG